MSTTRKFGRSGSPRQIERGSARPDDGENRSGDKSADVIETTCHRGHFGNNGTSFSLQSIGARGTTADTGWGGPNPSTGNGQKQPEPSTQPRLKRLSQPTHTRWPSNLSLLRQDWPHFHGLPSTTGTKSWPTSASWPATTAATVQPANEWSSTPTLFTSSRAHEFKLDRVSFQREGRPPTTPIGTTTERALCSQSHQTTPRMGPKTDEISSRIVYWFQNASRFFTKLINEASMRFQIPSGSCLDRQNVLNTGVPSARQ